MGQKRLKIPIVKSCEICSLPFDAWYSTTRSCSKTCKIEIIRQNTLRQFSSEDSKTKHGQITKLAMNNPSVRKKFEVGMSSRRSYKKENHPRWGVVLTDETKSKIGNGNRGKFKGQTWEQMYGVEMSNKRRIENAEKMAHTNCRLLNDRTSKLETKLFEHIKNLGFEKNQRISKYTVDLVNKNTKEIIEINGDYWHCNPTMFKPDYYNRSIKMTAEEKWEYDQNRKNFLESLGYSVKTVWESDIKNKTVDNWLD